MKKEDAWTVTHDLALIYIALAYGTDRKLSDEEVDTITTALRGWDRHLDADGAKEVVMEAMTVYLREDASEEITHSIDMLAGLSEQERRQAIEDVVRIAEADGILLSSEQGLIATLAEAWQVKPVEEQLLDQSTAEVEAFAVWSLLHDLSLVYVVVAHSTDDDLSEPEVTAILDRLQEWKPEFEEEDVRGVLREVLQFYADEPGEGALLDSVEAIKEVLPPIQRLVVLDDLYHIARADGVINEHEQEMITSLAEAWAVPVHMNSREG